VTELMLRRRNAETPFAFDLIRKAWQRDMRRLAIKRDTGGRFARD